MGLLGRLRSRARSAAAPRFPRSEPERSLAQLQARGTWLHVEPSGGPPRHGRKEPDLQVAWWWHQGARTVVLGTQVVSVLGPAEVRGGPLHFAEAEQVVMVGGGGPRPGGVQRARGASVSFDPDVPGHATGPAPAAVTVEELEPLLGRTVELRVTGGRTVDHGGVVLREGTEDLPVPRGELVAAVAGGGHVVLVLDDMTVAVLHEPCSLRRDADGTVRLEGDLGRVVLDVPAPDVHVARDATLQVRTTGGRRTDP